MFPDVDEYDLAEMSGQQIQQRRKALQQPLSSNKSE
jgi:hypothetical protein